tara:strand:- start:34423 stop:34683 length:261 start_codon:yes stop_codon:yes gene_type:complete
MENNIPLKSLEDTLNKNITRINSLNKEVIFSLIVLSLAWGAYFSFTATKNIMILVTIVALCYSFGSVFKINTLLTKNKKIRKKLKQ